MEGSCTTLATQQLSLPPAKLAEVVVLCCQVLTGLTLCTITDPCIA